MAEALEREDIENPEIIDHTLSLPKKGMQIHYEYTLYAHFKFLRKLFTGIQKIRFFLDQDSGLRAACLSVFYKEIKREP